MDRLANRIALVLTLLIAYADPDFARAADKADVAELARFVVGPKQPGIKYTHYLSRDGVSISGVVFDLHTTSGIERITALVPPFAPNARGTLVRVPWAEMKDVVIMISSVPSETTDFYSSNGPRLVLADLNADGILDAYVVGDAASTEIEDGDKKPTQEEQTFYDELIAGLLTLYRSLP